MQNLNLADLFLILQLPLLLSINNTFALLERETNELLNEKQELHVKLNLHTFFMLQVAVLREEI